MSFANEKKTEYFSKTIKIKKIIITKEMSPVYFLKDLNLNFFFSFDQRTQKKSFV